jgi:acetyl-CoA carboxylase carboxyl transferase subunit alpha
MADNAFDFEKVIAELEDLIARLKSPESRAEAKEQGIDAEEEVARLEGELRRVMIQHYSNLSPWEKVQVARYKDRPYSLDYIRSICDEFMELSGDRMAGNDEAVVGGFARLNGEPVVIIAQQKARDIKERQRRNFGMAHAEGFRKALRLAKMAEKFRKPLISFVDTAGAAADLKAEEHGVSEAIARNLREIALLETPVVSVIIGEGGSGGALGMAVADRVLMMEHSVYSVISPEGCASILWRDKAKAPDAASALQLTAQSAKRFGLVDEVLPEPLGGAHRNPLEMAETLKAALLKHLGSLRLLSTQNLVNARYARLRCLGVWEEKQP